MVQVHSHESLPYTAVLDWHPPTAQQMVGRDVFVGKAPIGLAEHSTASPTACAGSCFPHVALAR
eukprot:COSAG06_NODE_24514_length_660_cov_1.142602_1_plen_63_part_10